MSPLLLLILQVAVILATARVVGLLFRRIGQPQVVGEMVAGIVLGPSLLGWAAPAVFATLFPPDSLGALNALSQIGLLAFMFLVGLEFDPARLRGRGDAAVLTSHASIIAPFLLGSVLALLLYPRLSDASVPFAGFALFAGAAMSVTAFPVLARILTERNLIRTRLGAVAIACAAVDDVTAWSILAVVVVVVRASAAQVPLWVTVGGALLYVVLMITVVRRLLRLLEAYYLSRGRMTQDLVAGTVLLLLASAWMTERLGIHALFGAFALGVVMPKHPRFTRDLTERLEDVTVVLLLPLFFAFTGLRTSIGLLQGPQAWLLFGLVLLAATAGKFGGSAIASRAAGLSWREAGAVGVLMNTRGLMELVIITIGLELGVISPELFAMMVLMALVTTFMTTPLLELLYPERLRRADTLREAAEAGAVREGEGLVAVLPVSLPSAGIGLLRAAAACAGAQGLRRAYALHLSPSGDEMLTDLPSAKTLWTDEVLAPLMTSAQDRGIAATPVQFVSRDVARDITDVAEAKRADLIVMGWHKPVISRSALSGTVYEVMQRAACDVAVYIEGRQGAEGGWRRVLVPYVGGPHDRRAVELARRVATVEHAALTVLHVGPGTAPSEDGGEVDDSAWLGEAAGPDAQLIRVSAGEPRAALVREAKQGYDLIVLGVSAAWGTEPTMFSRRHEAIVAATSASLLVIRAGASAWSVAAADRVPMASAASPQPVP